MKIFIALLAGLIGIKIKELKQLAAPQAPAQGTLRRKSLT